MENNKKAIDKLNKYSLEEEKSFDEFLNELQVEDCIIFRELFKDTIGKSASNPVWGYVYSYANQKLKYKGIGLYKEYDYDAPNASYSEKTWSIIGKNLLDNVRVPNIDVVKESLQETGIISYRLMNNDKEDLIHISDILFNKFEREELKKKKNIINIDDMLECVKLQIKNEDNYKEVEKSMIQTLLLDSITNNADRHGNNWALIRNKQTNYYELADYDHSSAFVDMFEEQKHFTVRGWVSSYTNVKKNMRNITMGSMGNEMIEYIYENYKDYFKDFFNNFNNNFEKMMEETENANMKIDTSKLRDRLNDKKRFLYRIDKEGELEHE